MITKRLGRAKSQWETEAKTAAERAKLDETERLKAEKADADNAVAAAKLEVLTAKVETTAERQALAAGIRADRVDKFMRLVDLDINDLSADGKPDTAAIKKLIDAEVKANPEFKATPGTNGASGGEHNGGNGDKPKPKTMEEAVAARMAAASS